MTTDPQPQPTDAPLCKRCKLKPVRWGPRTNAWRTYCGGNNCNNTHRKCAQCQQAVHVDDFRFAKYCSPECARAAHESRWDARGDWHTCVTCGDTSQSAKPTPHGWRDGRCTNCWVTHIGTDRMRPMRLHHVSWDLALSWADSNWTCTLCLRYVPLTQAVVDHDHRCCPGNRSCGKCVRGYLHSNCNVALGYLNNDPDLALRAAVYLER